jgi:hypothetical protein
MVTLKKNALQQIQRKMNTYVTETRNYKEHQKPLLTFSLLR